ncbi:MAG: bifunctional riboflavin kinase/FAD synthetase [Deltaproteobacteria bacterium]|nr:bifunctional riboflavin kinase/FAD synthetase [Deltaproteobacteria bacterium]
MPRAPADFVAPARGCAVAIGNFDGVHRGHLAVIQVLREAAASLGAASCVYTFQPAPTAVVAPQRHQPRIQTLDDRVDSLLAAGVEHVVVEAFTPEFAAQSAERFVGAVLAERLRTRALVVGHDFRFGNMRAGNAGSIRALLPGALVHEVGALEHEGEPISSSRVRRAVGSGDMRLAAALLGRPHVSTGTVVHGDHLGRTLGFPTANLSLAEELRPGHGVYAARVGEHLAVVNVGLRPTVSGQAFRFEVHLLDFSGDLYGQHLRVALVEKLRDERRFESVDALRAQIARDVDHARRVHA